MSRLARIAIIFRITSSTRLHLMTQITAYFAHKNAAQNARENLQNTPNIDASRMHIWNDVDASSSQGAESGAIIGGALFCVSGLLGGAALGGTYDDISSSSSSTQSARLVIKVHTNDERILEEQTMRDAGAKRVAISVSTC